MAVPWIKIETNTPDKPEVAQLASILKIPRDEVVGKLLRLWIWADANVSDCNAVRVTAALLDEIAGKNGFAEALRKVGWLTGKNMAFALPNWDRHNGKSSKQRALTALRVTAHRYKGNASRNPPRVTPVTLPPLPEEIRGEESTTTPIARAPESPPPPVPTPPDEPHIPSEAEVVEFGRKWPGNPAAMVPGPVPEAFCVEFHHKHQAENRWLREGRLINWREVLTGPKWWRGQWRDWAKKTAPAGASEKTGAARAFAHEAKPGKKLKFL
jgi:hypothetical protein